MIRKQFHLTEGICLVLTTYKERTGNSESQFVRDAIIEKAMRDAKKLNQIQG